MAEKSTEIYWFLVMAGIDEAEAKDFVLMLPDSSWTARRKRKKCLRKYEGLIELAMYAKQKAQQETPLKGML